MPVDVQLLNVGRRLLTCRRRWIDALRLVNDNQVVRLRVHMPLPQPRFVNLNVLDSQIANSVYEYTAILGNLLEEPNCVERLTTTGHPRNQRNHLLNTIFVVDVSR